MCLPLYRRLVRASGGHWRRVPSAEAHAPVHFPQPVTQDAASEARLWFRRVDVTLANPLGPPALGWEQVERTLDHAASQIREGEPVRFERLSGYGTPDLAYTLVIERPGQRWVAASR